MVHPPFDVHMTTAIHNKDRGTAALRTHIDTTVKEAGFEQKMTRNYFYFNVC